MDKYSRESLEKLLLLIDDIINDEEYLWFKQKLQKNNEFLPFKVGEMDRPIDEIYEYCIKNIIKEQATDFYQDFKVENIKTKLIEDFIRMEHFKRESNFEDFCLAMFQQLEGIVNSLVSEEIKNFIIENQNNSFHKIKDKFTNKYVDTPLRKLIFYPSISEKDLSIRLSKSILEWDFSEKFKTILFYYYFDKKIYNYYDFQNIFFQGNELYQARNLNHRGGRITESQQKSISKIISNSPRYYFKFFGFLENFTSKVNEKL